MPPITITPKTAIVAVGRRVQLSSPGAKWSSQNPSVATVDAMGLVTGQSIGQATILAKKGNSKAFATVTVVAAPEPPTPIPPEPIPPDPIPPTPDGAYGPQSTIICGGEIPIPPISDASYGPQSAILCG